MHKTINTMINKHIIGVFDEEDRMVKALEALKHNRLNVLEVFTPYPVSEVFPLLGRKTSFTWWSFGYGAFAVLGVLSFLYYTSVIDWPVNFGGKPFNAFPSFIVITIVLTILSITILGLFTFSFMARIYPGKKADPEDVRATDDKFVIVVEAGKNEGDLSLVNNVLQLNGAVEVYEKDINTDKDSVAL